MPNLYFTLPIHLHSSLLEKVFSTPSTSSSYFSGSSEGELPEGPEGELVVGAELGLELGETDCCEFSLPVVLVDVTGSVLLSAVFLESLFGESVALEGPGWSSLPPSITHSYYKR